MGLVGMEHRSICRSSIHPCMHACIHTTHTCFQAAVLPQEEPVLRGKGERLARGGRLRRVEVRVEEALHRGDACLEINKVVKGATAVYVSGAPVSFCRRGAEGSARAGGIWSSSSSSSDGGEAGEGERRQEKEQQT